MIPPAAIQGPRVSLIVPVYDEVECLPGLLDEIRDAMAGQDWPYEVVLVDDGSRDGSAELLDQRAAEDPHLVVVHLERNFGQTAAFIAGFRRARGEVLVTLDADGQNPPAEIPKLLEALSQGADVVAGYRRRRQDSAWRKLQSRIANSVRNRVSGESIRDTGCSLKAIRSELLADFPPFHGMHRFIPTLCRLAGAERVVEVPVDHRPRQGGRSKYGMLNRAVRSFVDLLAIRWMQSRWLRFRVRPEPGAAERRVN
jgi:glycosyltransferase involved in cell wall biosynthesis